MNIRPFAALRPEPAKAAAVAAVPYDVVDTSEAKALAEGNPDSFLHVSRPEIDLADGTDCSSPEAYAQAYKALSDLEARGTLVREAGPRFYAYRQTMGGHSQTGVVGCFAAADYRAGVLKQHEKTRKDKEDDRTRHIFTLKAHTGPVFLTYRDESSVDTLVAKACETEPLYDFTASDGIRHTVWTFDPSLNEAVEKAFAAVPVAYIADGHHRAAAASRASAERGGEYDWFMAVIFPASQLNILPYNRLLKDLNGLSAEEFLARVKEVFAVSPAADGRPASGRSCRMYFGGAWYDLGWDVPEGCDPVSSLDVSVLQDRLLAPVLGIDDPRTSPRISFMGGIRGLGELQARVDDGSNAVAFSMYPVTVGEMMDIADAQAVMPPKSTWFEPKLRSGLFVHTAE